MPDDPLQFIVSKMVIDIVDHCLSFRLSCRMCRVCPELVSALDGYLLCREGSWEVRGTARYVLYVLRLLIESTYPAHPSPSQPIPAIASYHALFHHIWEIRATSVAVLWHTARQAR